MKNVSKRNVSFFAYSTVKSGIVPLGGRVWILYIIFIMGQSKHGSYCIECNSFQVPEAFLAYGSGSLEVEIDMLRLSGKSFLNIIVGCGVSSNIKD